MGQDEDGETSLHGLAAARGLDGPRRIVQFAGGTYGRIPDIDIQAQGAFHLPLSDGAKADLIPGGMPGSGKEDARRNGENAQERQQETHGTPEGGKKLRCA